MGQEALSHCWRKTEKLPFEALNEVNKRLRSQAVRREGVYVAHDSMGYARYIGRGRIFARLRSCRDRHKLEVKYFSFYVVEEKKHEREIETLLIHAAGPRSYYREAFCSLRASEPHQSPQAECATPFSLSI
jgi:hypothetical protein